MGQKILILNGSPRERGNTAALTGEAIRGVVEAGGQAESIYLHGLDIRPCDACDSCREQREGCIVEDDMQTVYPKLLAADALLLAGPVYWFTYSAQLKLCIDRWYGLWNAHPDFLRGKPVGAILVYGDTDLYTSGGINAIHTFETMFRFLRAEVAGFVYGTANDPGDAEKQPELMRRAYELGKKLGSGWHVSGD
jgi:multimeric flavodoxin WrbA